MLTLRSRIGARAKPTKTKIAANAHFRIVTRFPPFKPVAST
jgi:hypothetical protein